MPSRGLVPLALGLAVLFTPGFARACCTGDRLIDLERCRTAPLAYAGTVEAVDAPFLFELESDTIVRLNVDTVWRGDPPAALLAYTGSCGLVTPAPGTPFLACEDGAGDRSWTVFSMCGYPRFGEASELRAMLGPGRAPTAAPALRWQRWCTAELLFSLAYRLALPLLGITFGAVLGRWARRRAAQAITAASSPIRGLLLLAATMLAARLCWRAALTDSHMGLWYGEAHGKVVAGATVLVSTLAGLWLAYRGQRRPDRRGPWCGLALAFIGAGLMLFAGFVRLHIPIQPAGAIACSEARAREFLRSVPIRYDFREEEDDEWDPSPATLAVREEALRIAHDAVPYACTDWGLRRMRFDPAGSCLEYDDGFGGTYRKCADPAWDGYNVEDPG